MRFGRCVHGFYCWLPERPPKLEPELSASGVGIDHHAGEVQLGACQRHQLFVAGAFHPGPPLLPGLAYSFDPTTSTRPPKNPNPLEASYWKSLSYSGVTLTSLANAYLLGELRVRLRNFLCGVSLLRCGPG